MGKKGLLYVDGDHQVKGVRKKETIKIAVYVGDEIRPLKDITIGGKKLVKLDGPIIDFNSGYQGYYYSEKASGKIRVSMNKGCKVRG